MPNILFEPFKIKVVEALPESTEAQRRQWIKDVHYNIFSLRADQVMIDLLTDSGTSAMSDKQWAEMITGDESYAGSKSFLDLEEFGKSLTGMEHVIPVHQGRAAERLLFGTLLHGGELIPSNGLFDTTQANVEMCKAEGLNIPCTEGLDPFLDAPFKGNIDLNRLAEALDQHGERIPFVLMTITNNTSGGQPVSFQNLEAVSELCKKYNKMLVLDACRFAENAYFIKLHEDGFAEKSPEDIAQKCFALADAVTFSGKKDAFANIGGLLCVRDTGLSEALKNRMIVVEGFPTYGGLAGYSMAAMKQGLEEVLDERYLRYRLRTISWMVERLAAEDVPVLQPGGGHAVYIESSKFFPQIPRENFPGIRLSTELYTRGGIRACELGSVAFGKRAEDGAHILPPLDLVRLAIPRRVYTEAHMGYVVEVLKSIFADRDSLRGFEFSEESPVMRHFRSKFRALAE